MVKLNAKSFRSFDNDQVVAALRASFEYDPISGRLVWKYRSEGHDTPVRERGAITLFNRTYAGKEAGGGDMRSLRFYGRPFPRTHVIWAIAFNRLPSAVIDHIDGNPKNNKLANLREVESIENSHNMAIFKTNTSGVTGVYFVSARRKWGASIYMRQAKLSLGLFASFDEAVAARKRAERELNYHPNHGRLPRREVSQ